MVDPTRHRRGSRPFHWTPWAGPPTALVLAFSLILPPSAWAAGAAPDEPTAEERSPEADESAPEGEQPGDTAAGESKSDADAPPEDPPPEDEAPPEETEADADAADEDGAPPPAEPEAGGVAGGSSGASKEESAKAQQELEGDVMSGSGAGAPARMPPMEAAAWWTMFGTLALATTAGVFSGLAEKQEDEAARLAHQFDDNGNQLLYADHEEEYQDILDRGERNQWVARGLLIASGVALAVGITLFAVNAKRKKANRKRAAVRGSGVEVRF